MLEVGGPLVAAALMSLGCGDTADGTERAPTLPGTDPERNRVGPGEVCDRLTLIQCAAESACCEQPGRDYAECTKLMLIGCRDELLLDFVSDESEVGFDAEQAEQTFAELERLAADCDPSIASFGASHDGLPALFSGTVQPGGNCAPLIAVNEVMVAAAVASCRRHETHACLPRNTMWRCDPLSDEDGRCFTDINCSVGLFCDNPGYDLQNVHYCLAQRDLGEPCELANECSSLVCKGKQCVEATIQAVYCLDDDAQSQR